MSLVIRSKSIPSALIEFSPVIDLSVLLPQLPQSKAICRILFMRKSVPFHWLLSIFMHGFYILLTFIPDQLEVIVF